MGLKIARKLANVHVRKSYSIITVQNIITVLKPSCATYFKKYLGDV